MKRPRKRKSLKKKQVSKGYFTMALNYIEVSKCNLCPNLSQDHVPAYGSMHAQLMIIGQSPGAYEVQKRKPFVGACGQLLDFMLDEAELDRDSVYLTNALKCHPPGNRKGMEGELANCWRTWLHQEIQSVDPAIILVLGADAHKSVMPSKFKFGHLEEYKSKKRVYLCSYHPGWFLRKGPNGMEDFIQVGAKVKELLSEVEEI